MITVIGAQSRGVHPVASNGGEALAEIAEYYFGEVGAVILAVTVSLACLSPNRDWAGLSRRLPDLRWES